MDNHTKEVIDAAILDVERKMVARGRVPDDLDISLRLMASYGIDTELDYVREVRESS